MALAVYAFNTKRANDITTGIQSHAQNQVNITLEKVYAEVRTEYGVLAEGIKCFLVKVADAIREYNPLAGLPIDPVKDPHNCHSCSAASLALVSEDQTTHAAPASQPTKLFLEY